MSYDYTRRTANFCVSYMQQNGFTPQSIFNIGVSSGPECLVWSKLYPNIPIIGVDPKVPRDWVDFPYIQAVAVDSTSESAQFCFSCYSLICLHPVEHKNRKKWREVPTIRIDDISTELLPSPHLMWMDIEGGEIFALQGAERTLEHTAWICIETFDWIPGHANNVDKWLRSRGFDIKHRFDIDTLYQRMLPLGQSCRINK